MTLRMFLLVSVTGLALIDSAAAEDLRVGIIGLDTSHVVAFTRLLNRPDDPNHIAGVKVVAAFKGGSPDIPASADRVEEYTRQLRDEFGVRIVPSIAEMCGQVDAVLLESVDGRPHLSQARPVIAAGKPLFVDKPVAGSLRDVLELYRLAAAHHVPIFSSSAYRFYDSLVAVKKAQVGSIRSVISYGPAHLEPHHPDLFWYGIHPTEALFTILGTGCESVVRTTTPESDVVTGLWSGGRIGTLVSLHDDPAPHQVIVFGSKQVALQKGSGDYAPLVREIVRFFQTGVAPVSAEETVQIYAFMEAADESKREGGMRVRLQDVIQKNSPGQAP